MGERQRERDGERGKERVSVRGKAHLFDEKQAAISGAKGRGRAEEKPGRKEDQSGDVKWRKRGGKTERVKDEKRECEGERERER